MAGVLAILSAILGGSGYRFRYSGEMARFFGLLLALLSILPTAGWAKKEASEPTVFYSRNYGLLPSFEVKVFEDRTVVYTGRENARVTGERRFRIDESEYNAILRAFDDTEFSEMEESYASPVFDGPYILVLGLATSGHRKMLYAHPDGVSHWPRNLYKLTWVIEDTLNLHELLCPSEIRFDDGRLADRCVAAREFERRQFERAR